MLRIYETGGLTFQYEEGWQPAGARPVGDGRETAKAKAAKSRDKGRKAANKGEGEDA